MAVATCNKTPAYIHIYPDDDDDALNDIVF